MRPKLTWLERKYTHHLLDVRISRQHVYVQVYRVVFSWTYNPLDGVS
jgi:hypothetical protein